MKRCFTLCSLVLAFEWFLVLSQLGLLATLASSTTLNPKYEDLDSEKLNQLSARWWQVEYNRQRRMSVPEKLATDKSNIDNSTNQSMPNFDFLMLKTITRFELMYEQMFRMLDRFENRLDRKLNEFMEQINNIEFVQQSNGLDNEKLIINASEPSRPVKLGWGRFLPNPRVSSNQTNWTEKLDVDFYGLKILHKIEQVNKNLSFVVNQTTTILDQAKNTLLTREEMTRFADDAKEHATNLVFQLASEWSKSSKPAVQPIAQDCSERQLQLQSIYGSNWTEEVARNQSGVHQIWPARSHAPFMVYCDFVTDKGAWTVIQSRSDAATSFYRDWSEFKHGFGNINGDHWLGLQHIYRLTNQAVYELRVELENFENERVYARYAAFAIGSQAEQYQLKVLGPYVDGDAGDALSYHAGMKFSTKDRDNDLWSTDSCAKEHMGGWWYNHCESANLNGLYLNGFEGGTGYRGMFWSEWLGPEYSLKRVQMKIRPVKTAGTSAEYSGHQVTTTTSAVNEN